MSIHLKTALIVLSTLIVGIFCGALISGAIRQDRRERFFGSPSPERFIGQMEQIIRPDAVQSEAVVRILDKYRPRFAETMSRHRSEMSALLDSLHQELEPLLTEEQKERLGNRRMHGGRTDEHRGPGLPRRSQRPE